MTATTARSGVSVRRTGLYLVLIVFSVLVFYKGLGLAFHLWPKFLAG